MVGDSYALTNRYTLYDLTLRCKRLGGFRFLDDGTIRGVFHHPLLELAKCLAKGKNLEAVPNLIYDDGTKVCVNETCPPENIDSLPTPCFDDFPLDLYFSPELILPIMASRGCYWRKCAFCDHSHVYGNRYAPRNNERVVDDL